MTKLSNILLLLSAFLLVCNVVVAERAGSHQRRRIAVGDRESTAPSEAPSSEEVDMGKGSKSEKSKGSKSSSMKSAKSPKTAKKFKHLAELSKGYKSSKDSESKAADKSAKSLKSKSLKADKSSKKGPRTVPVPLPDDSISSKSSTYAITYSAMDEIPSPKDLEELAKITQEYLEDFMMDFFGKTALTDLDAFLTVMVRDVFVKGQPGIAEYQSNGLFNPDSIFIPVTRELDNLIADAIAQDEYLEMLGDLPKSNPFRGTETIGFTESDSDSPPGETTSGEGMSFVGFGVGAAAAGVVVLAAGLAILKRRRPSYDDENNEDVQSLTPRKSEFEDLTTAGETSAMGVEDASTHFSHWRTSRSYNDGDEFKDEPLDN